MGKKDSKPQSGCPPHNWVTVSTTTDSRNQVVSALQQCNKCSEERVIGAM